MRLVSTLMGYEHHVTVPRHRSVRVGTLDDILSDVASYLGNDKDQVVQELFDRLEALFRPFLILSATVTPAGGA